jgi:hypothetical protein
VHLHEEELLVVRLRPEERLHQSAEQLPVAELLDVSHLHVEELLAERLRPEESLLLAEELLDVSHLHVEELPVESQRAADASHLLVEELPVESLLHAEELLVERLLDADLFAEQLHPAEEFPDVRLCLDAELLQEEDSKASRTSWAKS